MNNEQLLEQKYKSFWYAEWTFPIFVAFLSAGIFAGTHMFYVYHVGAFNDIAIVAMLSAGIEGGSYGAAAAFGASFLFARVLEGSLIGILDIGGAIQTGLGIGVPALMLGAGITATITSFPLALVTGAVLGYIIGGIIIFIRKYTINQSNSTFGADIMMGAGNASGRYLGPLIVISAATASIPVGLGAIAGAGAFYAWKKPIAGGAIIGAMIMGAFFPLPLN
ncbi:DUF4310 family protein [Paenibacillus larvae]|uniref:DUF4310 family protein n=1 Tax=Paenibacillus larvae TaxID=1464 RepID=A0AAP5JQX3_9BACL|nr:DUF4310 family protein [Paenibacillus larvae]AQR76089.1 hypothetical protein BXP28_00265 [Paenibacillus larvae subsp. larvae]AVF23174.1 putative inner membrane protein [Paenibacillus larvae subsp. larvae]ETK26151.1 putative inner membrane protein [Paenibacillus larvae subsp. larvae DSM 25719]MCY7476658.1 DUF4310 family protein [Paenibacillus larvae]MCY7488208.1 DUF4310 family protein [Paenibacillus larvae]